VAAFIKRLARLALLAPPQDILIILYFISNLMIRHPGLKRLIYNQSCGGNEVVNDPFVMDECDPNKSNALQSSLWEIHMLKNHLLPSIATAAKVILSQPLPNKEWDLSNYLELNENDLFDHEISTKTREYALHFEKPLTVQQQKEQHKITSDKMPKYWKLF
jgi:U3 small nucleolar RNA-associated protein 19